MCNSKIYCYKTRNILYKEIKKNKIIKKTLKKIYSYDTIQKSVSFEP